MTNFSEQEQKIMDVFDAFWNALSTREIELRFSYCADDVTFIGTGLHERAINKAEYWRINDEGVRQYPDAISQRFLWKHLSTYGNVAWVECEVEWGQIIDQVTYKELVRNTTILKFDNGRWLIAHVHGSSPDYRFMDGAYMANEGTVKRNKELERQVFERTQELNTSLEQLKETQNQLIQSEKMASLGELTAGIAHEIQNPLNFVNNFSEINTELIAEMKQAISEGNLEELKILAADITANEQKINHHGKRADAIVKGMLQHSRSSAVKEPVDINNLADEYLRLAYHGLRAKDKAFNALMQTDYDPSIGQVNVMQQEIGRVMLNLITNAFYSVTERKSANEPGYDPKVKLATKKIGQFVEVRVSDNGNGIQEEVIDKIFQPFFTTKPTGQGTGLGLSMSYDIITKGHNGELRVESNEDGGATFIFVLPV